MTSVNLTKSVSIDVIVQIQLYRVQLKKMGCKTSWCNKKGSMRYFYDDAITKRVAKPRLKRHLLMR